MQKIRVCPGFCSILVLTSFVASCTGQPRSNASVKTNPVAVVPDTIDQIGEYVVKVYEDSKGTLWFGTMNEGAARYDGTSLTYSSTQDGLGGNTVTSFAEDTSGNLWIGTHSGLSKYDGKTFTTFTQNEGLCHDRVSNLLIDNAGNLWVGTWDGVCRFNGNAFVAFPIPIPDVALHSYQTTMDWITEIMEDSHGNIWFGRDGYGASRYDGRTFTHFTKADGLASNNVQEIVEDGDGNIWFGSRVAERDSPEAQSRTGDGGLSRYDGESIVQFPDIRGLARNDIYAFTIDRAGNLWIGANGTGVYRYDGMKFTLFSETESADAMPYGFGVQSMREDKNGNLWFGMSGGLFRLIDSSFINITKDGPWE